MKRFITLCLILTLANSSLAQNIFTVRVLDHLSKKSLAEVEITVKDQKTYSNARGYAQFEAREGDTLFFSHADYSEKMIIVPSVSSFQTTMDLLQNKLLFDPNMEAFLKGIVKNLKYPTNLRSSDVQCYMVVFFEIDSTGKSKIIQVIGENTAGFSDQLNDIFEALPGRWDTSYTGLIFGLPMVFRKENGKDLFPPKLEGIKYDRLLSELKITSYTVR